MSFIIECEPFDPIQKINLDHQWKDCVWVKEAELPDLMHHEYVTSLGSKAFSMYKELLERE